MNMYRLLWLSCVAANLLVATGCGTKSPAVAPVEGLVMYNGIPAAGAVITFLPEQGRPATGVADDQGRFRLMTFAPGDGALPGEHTVLITKSEAMDPKNPYAPVRSLIPARYGERTKSDLKATVQIGKPNDFRFDLKN